MKMEPTVSSETSAIRTQTPGNYPKRNKLLLEHGKSLKTRRHKMFMGFEVFTMMYIKITVFSNMMSCSLVYWFHVIVLLIGSTHLPSILWNTMFIDSCMYICKSSICFTMTIIFDCIVRNSVHHVYSNIRLRLSDGWGGGGGKWI